MSPIPLDVVVTELSLDGSQLRSDLAKFSLLPGEPFLEFTELLLDILAGNTRVGQLQLHLEPQRARSIQQVSLGTSGVGDTSHPTKSCPVQVLPRLLDQDVVVALEDEHLKFNPDHLPIGVGEEETDEVFIQLIQATDVKIYPELGLFNGESLAGRHLTNPGRLQLGSEFLDGDDVHHGLFTIFLLVVKINHYFTFTIITENKN